MEDKGWRPWEVMKLTRAHINRVTGWPRGRDGVLTRPQPQGLGPPDPAADLAEQLFRAGLPRALARSRARQILSEAARGPEAAGEADALRAGPHGPPAEDA